MTRMNREQPPKIHSGANAVPRIQQRIPLVSLSGTFPAVIFSKTTIIKEKTTKKKSKKKMKEM